MADNRQRRQRLFDLLPRVFAEQPEGTAVAAVIDAMASALAQLDEGLNRTQRDHWLNLARGDTYDGEALSALEKLGRLLGIVRLNEEATDDYRQRLQLTAKILTRGLTTPRSLLELAIVTLGAEPCPRQSIDKDAVIAFGLPLGTFKKCSRCKSGSNQPCPNYENRVLDVVLTENAPHHRSFKTENALKPNDHFIISSDSLTEDVPEVRLEALDKDSPIQYPILQNIVTGEVMLFAGEINFGEVLSIWPQVSQEENAQFDTHDNVTAHAWSQQYPSGSAVLVKNDGSLTSVSNRIYYLTGDMFPPDNVLSDAKNVPRFADAVAHEGVRFADALSAGDTFDSKTVFVNNTDRKGAQFGGAGQTIRSPRICAGENEWLYGVYTKQDIKAVVGEFSGDLIDKAPQNSNDARASLSLSWWIRPPASFNLRISRNGWVERAERRGATQLFSKWLQQAKAAGVRASLDFPEPALTESLSVSESLSLKTIQQWQELLQLDDKPPLWQIEKTAQEQHELGEGALIWQGVFDQTRFDTSRSV
jgi:hypothetical protein